MVRGAPGLGDAYRSCRRLVRERDPAVYALTALMPRMLWPGCWALWAALAAVDDIVDSGAGHPAERAAGVQAWVSALDAELAAGTSTDMVRRALVDTIVRWGLDVADLRASFGVLAWRCASRPPAHLGRLAGEVAGDGQRVGQADPGPA